MVTLEHITSIREYLDEGQTVAVVLGPDLTDDQYLAASALFTGIENLGKNVGIYAPRLPKIDFLATDSVQIELGKENLVIEFDYSPEAVDKVSYHIGEESQRFYLTIKPKKGSKPLNKETVEMSYAGAEFDILFLVGVKNLEDLQQLYYGYEKIYESKVVVTLNNYKPSFGNLHLDYSSQSGLSEAMFEILQGMGITITADMATELLKGIEVASQDFTSLTATAEMFETIAQLMRLGARRTKKKPLRISRVLNQDEVGGVEQLKKVIERKETELIKSKSKQVGKVLKKVKKTPKSKKS